MKFSFLDSIFVVLITDDQTCEFEDGFCGYSPLSTDEIFKFKKQSYKTFLWQNLKLIYTASGDSIVVEHSPKHCKVEGLSPATAAGYGRDKMAKMFTHCHCLQQ
jgi:hypothetical protein